MEQTRMIKSLIVMMIMMMMSLAVHSAALPSRAGHSSMMIRHKSSTSKGGWGSAASSSSAMVAPQYRYYRGQLAAQMGGSVVSDTFFGGFHNFLSLYNLVLTGRILLSWFPNIARQPVFEPLFVVTNPFFNIFRGLIPPIGGVDLSPLPAFFLLSFLTNATESLGAELPSSRKGGNKQQEQQQTKQGRGFFGGLRLPQRSIVQGRTAAVAGASSRP